MSKARIPCPTEGVEQRNLFAWARLQEHVHPELKLLHHIPNEGKRSMVTGARLRDEGMRSGVPDICLPVARAGFHGLYIELKRLRGSRVSDAQRAWLAALTAQGYRAVICKGCEEARQEILRYLEHAV